MTMNTLKTNPKMQTQLVRQAEFKRLQPVLARLHASHPDPGVVGIRVNQWCRTLPPLCAHLALLSSYSLTLESAGLVNPERTALIEHFQQRIADLVNAAIPAHSTYAEAHEYVMQRIVELLCEEDEEYGPLDDENWSSVSA